MGGPAGPPIFHWRRGWGLNPRHRDYPCTAFPLPHLRPLGHPSDRNAPTPVGGVSGGAAVAPPDVNQLAEGRGFEPPRDLLGPYPISSRTPSTGLGHPSAPILLGAYLLLHLAR